MSHLRPPRHQHTSAQHTASSCLPAHFTPKEPRWSHPPHTHRQYWTSGKPETLSNNTHDCATEWCNVWKGEAALNKEMRSVWFVQIMKPLRCVTKSVDTLPEYDEDSVSRFYFEVMCISFLSSTMSADIWCSVITLRINDIILAKPMAFLSLSMH